MRSRLAAVAVVAIASLVVLAGSAMAQTESNAGVDPMTNLPPEGYADSPPTASNATWFSVADRMGRSSIGSAPHWLKERVRDDRERDEELIIVYRPWYCYYSLGPRLHYYGGWRPRTGLGPVRPVRPPVPPYARLRPPPRERLHLDVGWRHHTEPSWSLRLNVQSHPWVR